MAFDVSRLARAADVRIELKSIVEQQVKLAGLKALTKSELEGAVDEGEHAQIGLVAGSCYLHDEEYRGPQAKSEWRGIIVCHDVADGDYDHVAEQAFFMCGGLDDVERQAAEIEKNL